MEVSLISYIVSFLLFNINLIATKPEHEVNKYVWKLAAYQNKELIIFDEKQNSIIGGVGFDIFNTIQKKLNFSYEIVKPIPLTSGTRHANGSWSGAIAQIKNKEADIGFACTTITYERFNIVNFASPIFSYRITFVVKSPETHSDLASLVKPYSLEVWIAIFAIFPIFGLILYKIITFKIVFEEMNVYWPRMKVFWFLFGTLAYQGANLNSIHRFPPRFLIGIWLLSTVVLLMSYSGVLISFLTCPTLETIPTNFKELEDAVSKGEYSCGASGGNAPSTYFMVCISDKVIKNTESKSGPGKVLAKHILLNNHFFNFEEGLNQVLKGKFAYIHTDYILGKLTQEYGSNHFVISQDTSVTFSTTYAMKKGFMFRKQVNNIIVRLYDAGIATKSFYSWKKPDMISFEEKRIRPLKIEDLQSPFVLLICGYIISLICFFIELIVTKATC